MSQTDNSINSVMTRMLEPAGLDEGHLSKTLGSMMQGGVDYADLYFQVSRQESWPSKIASFGRAASVSTRVSGFALSAARKPAWHIPMSWSCLRSNTQRALLVQ